MCSPLHFAFNPHNAEDSLGQRQPLWSAEHAIRYVLRHLVIPFEPVRKFMVRYWYITVFLVLSQGHLRGQFLMVRQQCHPLATISLLDPNHSTVQQKCIPHKLGQTLTKPFLIPIRPNLYPSQSRLSSPQHGFPCPRLQTIHIIRLLLVSLRNIRLLLPRHILIA